MQSLQYILYLHLSVYNCFPLFINLRLLLISSVYILDSIFPEFAWCFPHIFISIFLHNLLLIYDIFIINTFLTILLHSLLQMQNLLQNLLTNPYLLCFLPPYQIFHYSIYHLNHLLSQILNCLFSHPDFQVLGYNYITYIIILASRYYSIAAFHSSKIFLNLPDIDECKAVPGVCGENGKCTNTIGSYHCEKCDVGFKYDDQAARCIGKSM